MRSEKIRKSGFSPKCILALALFALLAIPVLAGDLPGPKKVGFMTGPQGGSPRDIALDHVRKNRVQMGLSAEDIRDMGVREQANRVSGFTRVQLDQTHRGISVHNGMILVNVTARGEIINRHNHFVKNLASRVRAEHADLNQRQAVVLAAKHLGLPILGDLRDLQNTGGAERRMVFSGAGLSDEDIPVRLIYVEGNKGQVHLTWEVIIKDDANRDWWQIHVDAVSGAEVTRFNYTIKEDFIDQLHKAGRAEALVTPLDVQTGLPTPPEPMADGYRVYPWPVENPLYSSPVAPADGRTLVSDPAADASALASPFGWHATSSQSWTTTQGNNAWTHNTSLGTISDCGATLDCDHALDLTTAPNTGTNPDAGMDNLFYWNNVVHDVFYNYGFTETMLNFQEDNNGQGGAGGDDVDVRAQDPGNCNAFFSTPADGSQPYMLSLTCDIASPTRDGAFDNLVTAHEYGHGISNRMTGGSSVSCLNNSEQMGEGWSDFFGLIMTMEPGDTGADYRGAGTWLVGESAGGPGIRTQPYSTDFGINNHTYGNLSGMAIPHGVGEIWATFLWEMTWELIANGVSHSGFDADLYNGTGGNNLALQLVVDGLALQPCSPGFVDGRDAILQADMNLTGGQNQCVIWAAFARRGLGFSADQGSSGSTSDGTEAFDIPSACDFLSPTPTHRDVCVGSSTNYSVDVNPGYTTPPVTLGVSGNPAGSSATFSVNPVNGPLPGTSVLTVDNLDAADVGSHTLTLTGDDGTDNESTAVTLDVFPISLGTPTLIAPADTATGVSIFPDLSWSAVAGAADYYLEIDNDPGFGSVDYSATVTGTSHTVATNLTGLTTYYWRVRAQNLCVNGAYPTAFSFTTVDVVCATFDSTDVPKLIPDSGTGPGSNSSTLAIANAGAIMGLEVQNLVGTHTWMGDLDFVLQSPGGTSVTILDTGSCGNVDDFNLNLADNAASAPPCPPTGGGTYQPANPLSAYNNEDATGTWTLTINDSAGGDSGSLNSWSLFVCYAPPGPDFTIDASPASREVCQGEDATYTIDVGSVSGFTGDVTLSSTGEPAGTGVGFSPNPVSPSPGSSTMTVSGTGGAAAGASTITVTGTGAPGTHADTVDLTIVAPVGTTTLSSPANAATGVVPSPTLSWTAAANAVTYTVEVATDSGFTNIVYTNNPGGTSDLVTPALNTCTTYYWRVTPVNSCNNGVAAGPFSFTTANGGGTLTFASTDVPVALPDSGTATSTVDVSGITAIADLNVLNLVGTHTYMGDLDFTLTSPLGTTITILDTGACGTQEDFNLGLDDESINGPSGCPPISGMVHTPTNPLSGFDGEDPTGTWTFTSNDSAGGDSGQLNSWSLEITDTSGGACPAGTPAEPSGIGSGFPLQVVSTSNNAVVVEKVNGATAYNVFMDAIGDWYSPDNSGASQCTITSWTDNGSTVTLDVTVPENHWVTVSASNASGESSAGLDSSSNQRTATGTWPTCSLGP